MTFHHRYLIYSTSLPHRRRLYLFVCHSCATLSWCCSLVGGIWLRWLINNGTSYRSQPHLIYLAAAASWLGGGGAKSAASSNVSLKYMKPSTPNYLSQRKQIQVQHRCHTGKTLVPKVHAVVVHACCTEQFRNCRMWHVLRTFFAS